MPVDDPYKSLSTGTRGDHARALVFCSDIFLTVVVLFPLVDGCVPPRHRAAVNRCKLLKGVSEGFLNQLVLRLHRRFMQPGERIFKEGDMARDLCIVEDGEVDLFHRKCRNAERFRTEQTKDGVSVTQGFLRSVNRESEGGSMVGEHAFFLRISQPFTMAASEVSVTTLLCISKHDYEEIALMNPSDHNKICANLLRPLGLKKDGSEINSAVKTADEHVMKKKKDISDTGSVAGKSDAEGAQGSEAGSQAASSRHSKGSSRGSSASSTSGDGQSDAGGGTSAKAYRDETSAIARSVKRTIKQVLQKRVQDSITSLLNACQQNDLDEIKTLLKTEVNVNTPDYDGNVPLHFAASNGNSRVVEVLLLAGANYNLKDRYGHSAMYEAVMKNHEKVVDVLKTRGLELEIEDPAGQLCEAASNNDVNLLKRLIDNGISPDCGDYDARTALHLAASEGNDKAVEWLVDNKSANVNVKDRWGNTPMNDAVARGHEIAARLLFEAGGRMDDANSSGMMCGAASDDDLPLLRLLHESGCDVGVGDYDRRTPLHLAAAEGNEVAVSFLLAAHADVLYRDRWGCTAIDDAIRGGHVNVAKLLVAAGAPPPTEGVKFTPEAQQRYDQLELAEVRRCAAEGEMMHIRRGRRMKQLEEYLKKLVARLEIQRSDDERYSVLLFDVLGKTMPEAITRRGSARQEAERPEPGSSFWRLSEEANRIEEHVSRRLDMVSNSASFERMPRTFNAFIMTLSVVQEGLEVIHKAFTQHASPIPIVRRKRTEDVSSRSSHASHSRPGQARRKTDGRAADERRGATDGATDPILTPRQLSDMVRSELTILLDDATANLINTEAGSGGITFKALVASQTFASHMLNSGVDGPEHKQKVRYAFALLDEGFKLLDTNLEGELEKSELLQAHSSGDITLPPELRDACENSEESKLSQGEFNVCILCTVDVLTAGAGDTTIVEDDASDSSTEELYKQRRRGSLDVEVRDGERTTSSSQDVVKIKVKSGCCGLLKRCLGRCMRDASLSNSNMRQLQVKVLDALIREVTDGNTEESSSRIEMAIDAAFRFADDDDDEEIPIGGFEQLLVSLEIPMPTKVALALMQSFADPSDKASDGTKLRQRDFSSVLLQLHKKRSEAENKPSTPTVTLHSDGEPKPALFVVRPEATWFRCWRGMMVALAIYYFIMVPYNISFVCFRDCQTRTFFSEWGVDCLLWVDIVINSRLAYTNSKSIRVLDPTKIRMHYLKTAFNYDLLAAAPIDILAYFLGTPSMFVVACFRIPRLLRLRDYARFIKSERNNLYANQLRVELQWLFSMMASIFHITAVVYWSLTQQLGDHSHIERVHVLGSASIHTFCALPEECSSSEQYLFGACTI